MIHGTSNKLTLNEKSLIVAVQKWIDNECNHPPKVLSINYNGPGNTFDIILGSP